MNMDIITTKLMIVAVELIIGLMSACMCWRCAYWPDQVGFKELYNNQSHVFGLSQTQQLDFPRDPYDQNWNRQHHPFVHKETPFNGGSTQSLSALPRNAYTNYPQWNGEQQAPVHRNLSFPRDRIEAPTSWMIPRNNRSRQQDNSSPYDEPLFDQRRWPDVGQSRTNAGPDHFNDNRQRHPEYPPKTSYQQARTQQQPNSYQSYRNWEHHY